VNLKEYLIKYRIDPDEFAVSANISISSLYRYLAGGGMHPKTARHLEKFTEGECTYEELLKLYEQRKQ
jgi:predicted transcriptional regulator